MAQIHDLTLSDLDSVSIDAYTKSNLADCNSSFKNGNNGSAQIDCHSTVLISDNTSMYGARCLSSFDLSSSAPSIVFSDDGERSTTNLANPTPWRTREPSADRPNSHSAFTTHVKSAKKLTKTGPKSKKDNEKNSSRLASSFAAFAFTDDEKTAATRIKLPFKNHAKMEVWLEFILEHSFLIYQSIRRIQRAWRRSLLMRRVKLK
ncbi:hypothetical protein BDR26DRAFT_126045 [Obelidium mucronatum]|nr:hypothetical protein BDR26DRAFT_126045 [Obelidium mucronatum]